jgi:PAS domain S-box-containing protein
MSRSDDLKNRLDELFSALPDADSGELPPVEPKGPPGKAVSAPPASTAAPVTVSSTGENAQEWDQTQSGQMAEMPPRAELLAAIIDATPDWIFVKDRDHRFVIVNQSFASALGREKDDFIGKNDLEMGFPKEAVMGDPTRGIQGYWWDDEKVLKTGEAQTILGEKNFINGQLRYFDVFKTALRNAQGNVVGLLGYARDVTERAKLLAEIQSTAEREQRLREITARVRSSSDADTILRTAVRELGNALGRKTFIRLTDSIETETPWASKPERSQAGDNGRYGRVVGGEQ